MSEINAIATNNFILHNIDAKKLYVQEPLFTANSGDAVYVGWRPDETVLYDQSANQNCSVTAEFQMNESLWNFHRAFIVLDNMEFANSPVNMEIDLDTTTTATNFYTPMRNGNSFPTLNIPYANFQINSSGNIKYLDRGLLYGTWTNPMTTTGDLRGYRVRKVIGINRKENA